MPLKKKIENLSARDRRKVRVRKKIRGSTEKPRICTYRSSKHMYAQIVCDVTGKTFVSASTRDKEVVAKLKTLDTEGLPSTAKSTKSVIAAKAVGMVLAERAQQNNISAVVFDRNGFLYHGRVKALADGAREGGLKF